MLKITKKEEVDFIESKYLRSFISEKIAGLFEENTASKISKISAVLWC